MTSAQGASKYGSHIVAGFAAHFGAMFLVQMFSEETQRPVSNSNRKMPDKDTGQGSPGTQPKILQALLQLSSQ